MKKVILISIIATLLGMTCAQAASVADLMHAATEPVGKCLYVYGGGWNEEDTAAGVEAMSLGISPRWEEFYNLNNSSYNYAKTRYQIHDGLDCTGYIGWCMYQVFGDTYSDTGYVYPSKLMAEAYSDLFGAELTLKGEVTDYKCGDIMSMPGHAYMVLGECIDGSVVFFHASPPNVSLCGTYTPAGKHDSEAVRLAQRYMSRYFTDCYSRYPGCSRGTSYLTDYHRVRLPHTVLPDTDGYREMSAEVILMDMFETVKLYVNGHRVAKQDSIYIRGDSTFVPLRAVSENLGAKVDWYGNEGRIVISQDGTQITVHTGSQLAEVNGEVYTLSSSVFIDNDKTYIPVRFIAEQLGGCVEWDEKWQKVMITKK